MVQNITLSADKELIEKARKRARKQNTTLNAEFRHWLTQYAESSQSETSFQTLMREMSYAKAGRSFSRDDLNER
jgi:hypothetical protein